MENPIKMDDLGGTVPLFSETSMYMYIYVINVNIRTIDIWCGKGARITCEEWPQPILSCWLIRKTLWEGSLLGVYCKLNKKRNDQPQPTTGWKSSTLISQENKFRLQLAIHHLCSVGFIAFYTTLIQKDLFYRFFSPKWTIVFVGRDSVACGVLFILGFSIS